VDACALFLFEKPGPKTSESGGGSGFISRNNDDPTAENTFNFMHEAQIPRELTVVWNIIPWWNGEIAFDHAELEDGLSCLRQLIDLLPKLKAVVLVGKKAGRARSFLEGRGLHVLESAHPSPKVKARWRNRWEAIPKEWAKVKSVCSSSYLKNGVEIC